MGMAKKQTPLIDVRDKRIVQIGIVVRDAARMAQRYTEIFGIGPWVFLDIAPTQMILHDQSLGDTEACVRVALADFESIQIELIQPLYGPSTHLEFCNEHGEGIHHLSFGRIDDHDGFVSALRAQGIGIEMQGVMGGADTFTYLATQQDLGTILEVVKRPGAERAVAPWGTYPPQGPGLLNTAGKRIAQVGIVVEDAERTAQRYWEIFGIGPWVLIDFKPPHVSDGVLHGIPMNEVGFHVRAAIADYSNLQLELLQPVHGPSTHMEFLKIHGQGAHHVSFGVVDDHDDVVSTLQKQGIGIEMSGLLGGAAKFTYLDTQEDLGTIFELVKPEPGVESTVVPYGTYPPSA
jgi:catechol 2,3-dioxygenase-like lactoylglutathione lyase family enzyme